MQIKTGQGGGATILVVDDDALITINTVDLVAELGHTPLEAFSGAEALRLVEAHPDIALLITDYSMPGMTGVELADTARQLRPGLPVLLATGYAELPEDTACDYPRLEKPFREQELASQIGNLLGASAASEEKASA